MITFKQYLIEDEGTLYANVTNHVADLLRAGKTVKNIGSNRAYMSFVKNKNHLKAEFGPKTICVKISDLPKTCEVITIVYDLAWFAQDKKHRDIMVYVTARTPESWVEEHGGDIDVADEELEVLYGDEKEVLVIGLTAMDPKIFKVL